MHNDLVIANKSQEETKTNSVSSSLNTFELHNMSVKSLVPTEDRHFSNV